MYNYLYVSHKKALNPLWILFKHKILSGLQEEEGEIWSVLLIVSILVRSLLAGIRKMGKEPNSHNSCYKTSNIKKSFKICVCLCLWVSLMLDPWNCCLKCQNVVMDHYSQLSDLNTWMNLLSMLLSDIVKGDQQKPLCIGKNAHCDIHFFFFKPASQLKEQSTTQCSYSDIQPFSHSAKWPLSKSLCHTVESLFLCSSIFECSN